MSKALTTRKPTTIVKYHNIINTSLVAKFSATELNILFFVFSRMLDKQTTAVVVNFSEIAEIIGFSKTSNRLLAKHIIITNRKFAQCLYEAVKEDNDFLQIPVFQKYETSLNTNTLTVQVSPQFAYLFNDLTSNFTMFILEDFCEIKTTYSKRVFLVLKQYRTTGLVRVTLDDFRHNLDIPASFKYTKIKSRVLDPSLEALASVFHQLKMNAHKSGQKIVSLEFTFTPESKNVLEASIKKRIEQSPTSLPPAPTRKPIKIKYITAGPPEPKEVDIFDLLVGNDDLFEDETIDSDANSDANSTTAEALDLTEKEDCETECANPQSTGIDQETQSEFDLKEARARNEKRVAFWRAATKERDAIKAEERAQREAGYYKRLAELGLGQPDLQKIPLL